MLRTIFDEFRYFFKRFLCGFLGEKNVAEQRRSIAEVSLRKSSEPLNTSIFHWKNTCFEGIAFFCLPRLCIIFDKEIVPKTSTEQKKFRIKD